MKKVVDSSGNEIVGLYRNSDSSLTLNNQEAYRKNKLHHDKFTNMTTEIDILKEQMKQILEKLNG